MSRTITLIAAVGASLVLVVPAAWSKGQPAEPQWMQALDARSQELNRQYGLGEYSPAIRALELRSEALNRKHGLGAYATSDTTKMLDARERALSVGREQQSTSMLDAREQVFGAKLQVQLTNGIPPDAFERAVQARGTGTTVDRFVANDNRFRVVPTNDPVPVEVTGSGREIEWPQIGIGLGVGIALMLGLVFALRATRHRPLAH
jgi:hypothetical protein